MNYDCHPEKLYLGWYGLQCAYSKSSKDVFI